VISDLSLDNYDNPKIISPLSSCGSDAWGFLVVISDMSSTERLNRRKGPKAWWLLVSLIQYLILDFAHAFTKPK
jgi:hypothetical protein